MGTRLAAAVVGLLGALPGQESLASWSFDEAAAPGEGTAWIPDGARGGALRFAGGHVEESGIRGLTHRDTFAVEAWVRTGQGGFATLLMARRGEEVSFSLVLGRRPGRVSFELWSWPRVRLLSRTGVADGRWHHVAGLYDAARGEAALVVDGRLESVARPGEGGPATAVLRLGDNLGARQPYAGDLDEVAVHLGLPPRLRELWTAYREWSFLPGGGCEAGERWLDALLPGPGPVPADREAWVRRREELRRRTRECLGLEPPPARLPLRLHVSGELIRPAYRLQRIWWQAWPEIYAGGWLYLPAGADGPAPAVLCPHGHWAGGARHPVVQTRCQALARLGFVVLAVDSVHGEEPALGLTPASLMTWNNSRALDLLCSLKDLVDPARIGCTGASGGGQQTMFLMALEDRIAAAAPVAMITRWRRICAADSAHCRCNHVPGLARFADMPDLCALFAPRPALFLCVTGDWTREFPRESLPAIAAHYALLGAPGAVACRQFDCGHDFNQEMREMVYGFMVRHLQGREAGERIPEPEVAPEPEAVLAGLGGPPAGARPFAAAAADFRARLLRPEPPAPGGDGWPAWCRRTQAGLAALLGEPELPDPAPRAVPGPVPLPAGAARAERILLHGEGGLPLPLAILFPAGQGPHPVAVVLHPEGKAGLIAGERELTALLLRSGAAVAAPDLPFRGDLAQDPEAARQNGLLLGRDSPALALAALRQVLRHLAGRADAGPAGLLALPGTEAEGLLAGALLEDLAAVAVPDLGPGYLEGRQEPAVGRLLTVADLPEAAALIPPRPLLLGGLSSAARSWLEAAAGNRARLAGDPVPPAAAAAWLATTLKAR